MIVKKLIEALSKMNPNAQVEIGGPEGENVLTCIEFDKTYATKNLPVVVIESAQHMDIMSELDARFLNANIDPYTDLNGNSTKFIDFIVDLIDTGFTDEQINSFIDTLSSILVEERDDAKMRVKNIFSIYNIMHMNKEEK